MKMLRLRMSIFLILSLSLILSVPQISYAKDRLPVWEAWSKLEVTQIEPGSVQLSWTPAKESMGYRIYGTEYGASNGILIGAVNGSTTSFHATNLKPKTVYTFKVEAERSDGSWTTDGPAFMAYIPLSILEATQIEPTSLHLSWTPFAEEGMGYRIYGDFILIGAVNGNTTSFHATNLKPNTAYTFRVETERYDGSWSTDGPSVRVSTPPQDTIKPIIESVSPADGEQLTTAWPKITAKVYDEDSGINLSKSTVTVNGLDVPFSYNEASKTLTAIAPRLLSGTNRLSISVTDNDGNNARYFNSFAVKYEAAAFFMEWSGKLRAALQAGDPSDVEDVRGLSSEIAELDEIDDLILIDPIWNKIKLKLPQSVDQAQLKRTLFRLIVTVGSLGSLPFDQRESRLEAILSDPEFRMTWDTIAAAGGVTDLTIEDVLTFIFGDGGIRRGIEGQILFSVSQLSPLEKIQLLSGDKQKLWEVITDAINYQVFMGTGDMGAPVYKISKLLSNLDINTYGDTGHISMVLRNFSRRLKHDVPAVQAMMFAYIRLKAQESAKVSNDGHRFSYSLKVANIEIPPLALKWSKISGSSQFMITPDGVASIAGEASTVTAVIQATLVNPFGGANTVIFRKELTLNDIIDVAGGA